MLCLSLVSSFPAYHYRFHFKRSECPPTQIRINVFCSDNSPNNLLSLCISKISLTRSLNQKSFLKKNYSTLLSHIGALSFSLARFWGSVFNVFSKSQIFLYFSLSSYFSVSYIGVNIYLSMFIIYVFLAHIKLALSLILRCKCSLRGKRKFQTPHRFELEKF